MAPSSCVDKNRGALLLGALSLSARGMTDSAWVACARECDLSGPAANAAACLQACSDRFSQKFAQPSDGTEGPVPLSTGVSVSLAVLLVHSLPNAMHNVIGFPTGFGG